ncbi:MAG: autotransporter domain-containing protein [Parvibaculum sp.]|nr:autotransporter domain-containing protein [Parvibaculum sp.]
MKKTLPVAAIGLAIAFGASPAVARQIVVLPGVVGPTGELDGVDTQGPGLLTVGAQDINTANDAGGGITTDAADTANIIFTDSSIITGFVGTVGSTFLDISAGTAGNTVTFNGAVFSTTFSVSGTGTINFNGGFTSNSGSTVDFAGDGFINLAAGQTLTGAITNTAGAHTGTLTLNANSIVAGAVGAASGLKLIEVVGGDALITGQVNAAEYIFGTNILNVGGTFEIPVAGIINTTIFSLSDYGHVVPVGAASIGNALQINVDVTGPIADGSSFNIVDAASGTNGSTVTATSSSLRYQFAALPTTNGLVQITATQVPLAVIVAPTADPVAPIIGPIVDALPVTPDTEPVLTAITLLPTPAAVAAALAQLAPGASNFGAPLTSFGVTQRFQSQLASHLDRVLPTCSEVGEYDKLNIVRYEDGTVCHPDGRHAHWWMTATGYFADQGNIGGFEGYDSRTLGLMIAYERALSATTRAGFGLTYAQSEVDANSFDNNVDINSYQATLFMRHAPGDWFANAALTYGYDDYTSRRNIDFPGFSATAAADYDGHQFTAYGVAGRHFYIDDGRTVFTPSTSLQYTHMRVGGYTETGAGGVNLNVGEQTYDFIQSSVGAEIARNFMLPGMQILRPALHANWLHSFGDRTMTNTASFTGGGPAFTIDAPARDRNTYNVGGGIELAGSPSWSIGAVYDHHWNNNSFSSDQIMLNLVLHL